MQNSVFKMFRRCLLYSLCLFNCILLHLLSTLFLRSKFYDYHVSKCVGTSNRGLYISVTILAYPSNFLDVWITLIFLCFIRSVIFNIMHVFWRKLNALCLAK